MPTRFYLPSAFGPAAPVNPNFSAEWENTSQADRRKCVITKTISLMEVAGYTESSATSPYDMLRRQYVSDLIRAQTISGTVKGQIRCAENVAAANFCRAIVIKVVSGDGSVVRGTLLSHFPASLVSEYIQASILPTEMENRYFPPSSSVTPVTAVEGDRIVIEIGTRAFNTKTTTYTASHHLGDAAATDLPEDETSTALSNPWVELSQTILFSSSAKFTEDLSTLRDKFSFVYTPIAVPIYKFIQNLSTISVKFIRRLTYRRTIRKDLGILQEKFKRVVGRVRKWIEDLRSIRVVLRRSLQLNRRLSEDLSSVVDAFTRRLKLARRFSEVLSVIRDVFSSVYTPFVVPVYRFVQNLSAISDVPRRVTTYTRKQIQQVLIGDVFKRILTFARKVVENLSAIRDIFTSPLVIVVRIYRFIQTVLVQDFLVRHISYTRRSVKVLYIQAKTVFRKVVIAIKKWVAWLSKKMKLSLEKPSKTQAEFKV